MSTQPKRTPATAWHPCAGGCPFGTIWIHVPEPPERGEGLCASCKRAGAVAQPQAIRRLPPLGAGRPRVDPTASRIANAARRGRLSGLSIALQAVRLRRGEAIMAGSSAVAHACKLLAEELDGLIHEGEGKPCRS